MSSRLLSWLLPLASIVLTACFLPIPYTEATSPPLVGRFIRSDSTPIAGSRIAVSTRWDDSSCAAPRVETRTDRSGAFRLPGTEQRHHWALIFPAFEKFGNVYSLCTGPSDSASGNVYAGRTGLRPRATPDTLTCIQWPSEAWRRTKCAATWEETIRTGGHWTDSTTGASGFYRVFITQEAPSDSTKGRRYVPAVSHLHVQWITADTTAQSSGSDSTHYIVQSTVDVPLDRSQLYDAHDVDLWEEGGRWQVAVEGFRQQFMDDFARAEVRVPLGAPGQVGALDAASGATASHDRAVSTITSLDSSGSLPLGRLPRGTNLRLSYPNGSRAMRVLETVGDSSVTLRAGTSGDSSRMTFASLRELTSVEARVPRENPDHYRYVGAGLGLVAGAMLGAALHPTGRDFNGRKDDGNLASFVGSHAFLGATFGYIFGPIVVGWTHWQRVSIPGPR